MLKKQEIIELIKENRTPFWNLASKKMEYSKDKEYKGSYSPPEGKGEEKINDDAQIAASIKKLETLFSFLTNEKCYCYEIAMKASKTASGANIITYQFVINENQNKEIENKTNGLAGFDPNSNNLGFVPLSMIEVERDKTKLAIEGMEQRFDLKYREQKISDKEDELKEKEAYYNNDINKLSDVARKTMPGILEGIFRIIATKNDSVLAGNTKIITEKIESPSEAIIERIASNLNNTFDRESDLLKLEAIINKIVYKIKNTGQNVVSEKNKSVKGGDNPPAPTECK